MIERTWLLFRARMAMTTRAGWPIPALLLQALVGTLFALLVRDALPPFPYAYFMLALNALLLAIPLVGELGGMLRRDEGGDWIKSLPLARLELSLARTLHVLVLLFALSLAALVPASLLAPSSFGSARFLLPLLGLGLMSLGAAFLLWIERALATRSPALFLALEILLVMGVMLGLIELLGSVRELALLRPGSALDPAAWFAAAATGEGSWIRPLLAAGAGLLALFLLPAPPAESSARRASVLAVLLRPLRATATRVWVRPDERGVFDLVVDGLAREREVVLRAYPMLGIPLAFLALAARSSEGTGVGWREDALALLLFTVGVYLPVLLTHVPATESPRASWILACSPVPEAAIVAGAIKGIFLRFLLPLYATLGLIAGVFAGPGFVLRLWLPALLVTLLVLRFLYPRCVTAPPLSTAPDDVRTELDWMGVLSVLAIVLTLVAVLANRWIEDALTGFCVAAVLLGVELVCARRLRSRPTPGKTSHGG